MKTRNLILLMAACVMSAACNETVEINVTPSAPLVTLNFTSVKPEVSNQTKTEYFDGHVLWSKTSDEKIRVALADNDVLNFEDKFYMSNKADVSDDAKVATFPAGSNIAGVVEAGHEYVAYALYPASASSKTSLDYELNPASVSATLPTTQESTLTSYNGAGDIMVGLSTEVISTLTSTDPVSLSWKRLVAINKVTLTNVGVDDGEKIQSVTFTTPADVYLTGVCYVDLKAQTLTPYGSSQNSVKVVLPEGADASAFDVWFTSFTAGVDEGKDLTIVVKTDLATYTRTITARTGGICFYANYLNKLRVDMSTAVKGDLPLVVEDGNYVIAATDGTTYYAINKNQNSPSSQRRDRTALTDGFDPASYTSVSPYAASNDIIWTITNVTGGVKINLATDAASYMKYGSSTLPLDTEANATTFEITEKDGTYTLTSSTNYVAMNGSYGFGCYTSSAMTRDLYIIPAVGTPELIFESTETTVTATTTSVQFPYTSSFLSETPSVVVTTDAGNAVESATVADGKVNVTLNENTTLSDKVVTLTVSAAGATDVVLAITQSGVVLPASKGDVLWQEDFSDVTVNSGSTTTGNSTCNINNVYAHGAVSYEYSDNGRNKTLVYGANSAGGTAPELLIGKKANAGATVWGVFKVSDIPTSGFSSMTLTFIANGVLTISSDTEGVTVGVESASGNNRTIIITNTLSANNFNLSFENQTTTNTRIDDIVLTAGAPDKTISVTTAAATGVSSVEGTTATLNGTISLLNGALITEVTEAGFYYKLSSAGSYTKVTVDPVSTTLTKDLTGLTTDAEYVYHAYAIYNGDEVVDEDKAFTPIVSAGGGSYTLDSDAIKNAHSSSWNYSSGEKSITAADGSVWIANNTYAISNQVTLQLKSGKSGYVATPVVSGKITKITVELTSSSNGTGTGTRGMNISDSEGTTIESSVSASELIAGHTITGNYNQLRLEPTGTTYIKSITINFE